MVNYHGHFVWYELVTMDCAAAQAFYTHVVGWSTQDASAPGFSYTLFNAGKASVAGLMQLPQEAARTGATPRWIGYVGVDDVDATVELIKRLGGAAVVPPTDIPNVSRFAIIADPQGATLALVRWLRPPQRPPDEVNKLGRVGWHELFAGDWEKAFAVYCELFGWRKADADSGPLGTYQVFCAEAQTIGGMLTKPPTMPVPFWLYYFNVADIDAAAARVRAAGGRIMEGPLEVPGGGSWIARCADPQGAVFALQGKRKSNTIGYFQPAAARSPRIT